MSHLGMQNPKAELIALAVLQYSQLTYAIPTRMGVQLASTAHPRHQRDEAAKDERKGESSNTALAGKE